MADVTSSLIGISINAINSWPAAAVRSPGCSEIGDKATPGTPSLRAPGSQLPFRSSLCHLGLSYQDNKQTNKITPTPGLHFHSKITFPCSLVTKVLLSFRIHKLEGQEGGAGDCHSKQEDCRNQEKFLD